MRVRPQRFDPRQVMQADTFEVFHYREPRPGVVDVHHHDFYEVYYLLAGRVEYWVEGRIIGMEPGDILLISPMELHRPIVGPESPVYERIVLWISKGYLEKVSAKDSRLSNCFDPGLPNLLRPGAVERPALTARMHELVREYHSKDFGSELCAKGLLLQLMVQLNRLAMDSPGQQEQLSELVQQTLSFISEHISAPLSLETIAGQFYVSKNHLSHAFSREMGVSIYRYIMLKRLLMARQLLLSGHSAGQVCSDCGFADYTSFYRAFKAEYGVSPRAFAAGVK